MMQAWSAGARERLARFVESFESRLWPMPVLAIVIAVAVGLILPRVDLILDPSLPTGVDSVSFNGGAETARSVLSAIAGSLITATSLTFSLTVVALQLASSQASPRVLRLFARDRHVQITLAVFLGTFAYSITALRSVRDATDQAPEFVPRLSVTTAFLLTLLSVVMLVLFLAHLASELRVETILRDIHAETDTTIDLVEKTTASLNSVEPPITRPATRHVVHSTSSGFITGRNRGALLQAATEHDIIIEELRHVGDNIVTGTPLAAWWASGAEHNSHSENIDRAVNAAHAMDYERTAAQDSDYGVQQIVDIAVRALSPGINDPATAVHALGHLSALLTRILAMHPMPAGVAGRDGELRLIPRRRTVDEAITEALSQIRHYGIPDPMLTRRFLQVVTDLAYTSPGPHVHAALDRQLDALISQLEKSTMDPSARELLLAEADTTRQNLA